jgi:hypothetical protein
MISYLRTKYYKYTHRARQAQSSILPFLTHLAKSLTKQLAEKNLPFEQNCLTTLVQKNANFLNICGQNQALLSLTSDWLSKKTDLAYLTELMKDSKTAKLPLQICNLIIAQAKHEVRNLTAAEQRFMLSCYIVQYEKELNEQFSELYLKDELFAYCWRKEQLKKILQFFSELPDFNAQVANEIDDSKLWLGHFVRQMKEQIGEEIRELNWQIAETIHTDKTSGRIMNVERQHWRKLFSLGALEDSPRVDMPLRYMFTYAEAKNKTEPSKLPLIQAYKEAIESADEQTALIKLKSFRIKLGEYRRHIELKWEAASFFTWLNPLNWIAYYREKKELSWLESMSQHLKGKAKEAKDQIQSLVINSENSAVKEISFPQEACESVIATGFSLEDATDRQLDDLLDNNSQQASIIPLYAELPNLSAAKNEARAKLDKKIKKLKIQEIDTQTKEAIIEDAAKIAKTLGSAPALIKRNINKQVGKFKEAFKETEDKIKLLIKQHKGSQAELKQRIKILEDANTLIKQKNERYNLFMGDECFKEFFNTVLARVTEYALAKKVIASGQVQSLKDNTELASSALQGLGKGLGSLVPGLSLVTGLVGALHDTRHNMIKTKIARLESELFPSIRQIDEFAFELAMLLTWRYSEQIMRLSRQPDPGISEKVAKIKIADNAIKMLADCMVVRVMEALWQAAENEIKAEAITCEWLASQVMALESTNACLFTTLGIDYGILHKDGTRKGIREVIEHPGIEHEGNYYKAKCGNFAFNPEEYGYIKGNSTDLKLDLEITTRSEPKAKKAIAFHLDYTKENTAVPAISPRHEKQQKQQATNLTRIVKKLDKEQQGIKREVAEIREQTCGEKKIIKQQVGNSMQLTFFKQETVQEEQITIEMPKSYEQNSLNNGSDNNSQEKHELIC